MDRLFAQGNINAAQSGDGPPLFFSRSFRVLVPQLPGFGRSPAVAGDFAAVADRMAEAVSDAAGGKDAIVLGNGYGGFVALQMAIRHPAMAAKLVLADCGAAFSEP